MLRRAMMAGNGDAPPVGWAEFTSTGKSAPAIVSGRILTRSAGSAYANARAGSSVTGNRYFSLSVVYATSGGVIGIGFVDGSTDISPTSYWMGSVGSAAGWGPNDSIYVNGSLVGGFSGGAQLEIAIDASSRSVWVRDTGGAWKGGGNPSTGVSPTFVVPGAGQIYFGATISGGTGATTRSVEIQSDPDDITGTAPSGFSAGYPA